MVSTRPGEISTSHPHAWLKDVGKVFLVWRHSQRSRSTGNFGLHHWWCSAITLHPIDAGNAREGKNGPKTIPTHGRHSSELLTPRGKLQGGGKRIVLRTHLYIKQ
eukprot:scaffold653_cov345-Pavlova_lutheri.AAC.4